MQGVARGLICCTSGTKLNSGQEEVASGGLILVKSFAYPKCNTAALYFASFLTILDTKQHQSYVG